MPFDKLSTSSVASAGPRNPGAPVAPPKASAVLRPMSRLNPANQPSVPAQRQQDAPAPNPWANGGGVTLAKSVASRAGPGLLKTAVTKSVHNRATSQAPVAQDPLATQMSQLNLNNPFNPNAAPFNPSDGPGASAVTTNWRFHGKTASQASKRSLRGALNTLVCVLSGYTRRDFRKGDVISLPFHVANTNPNVEPTDRRLALTCERPAYTKRRMMVVLWLYQQDMFCLPLYSFSGKGIQSKPAMLRREYVSMKNVGDIGFVNQGQYEPVEVQCRRRPMNAMTSVQLRGVVRVAREEDIQMVGWITEQSHVHLVGLWQRMNEVAQREGW